MTNETMTFTCSRCGFGPMAYCQWEGVRPVCEQCAPKVASCPDCASLQEDNRRFKGLSDELRAENEKLKEAAQILLVVVDAIKLRKEAALTGIEIIQVEDARAVLGEPK